MHDQIIFTAGFENILKLKFPPLIKIYFSNFPYRGKKKVNIKIVSSFSSANFTDKKKLKRRLRTWVWSLSRR